jgi:xylose isomerase
LPDSGFFVEHSVFHFCNIVLLGTSYAEYQSVDINLQELKTGQQKLREILENIQKEQKQSDLALMTYKVNFLTNLAISFGGYSS